MAAVTVSAGMLLANMIPGGPSIDLTHGQTADSSLEYSENGTRPVGTFRAHDQDGDSITWSLSGPDGDLFMIDGGVLHFAEPPNHEDPQSVAGGNVYTLTIEASGGTHDVSVTVTDVDEPGVVNISRPQPQVSRPLSASLSDEDVGVTAEKWQWSRSSDATTWTDIEGATSRIRSPTTDDVGMYLRATVTYSDRFGAGKTASAVSANRAEARTLSNAAPSFSDQDQDEDTPYIDVRWSVDENTAVGMKVGRAVSARDSDEDVLFYELEDTPDLKDSDEVARFTIDTSTGQIRVAKELGADTGEREDEDSRNLPGVPALPVGEDAGDSGNSEYVLRVRVSDPSTAHATVNVVVAVADVNEAPIFPEGAPTVLKVRENEDPLAITFGDGNTPVVAETYAVADPDGEESTYEPEYSVSGTDRSFLTFDSGNTLRFTAGHKPDYEKQSSYSITVMARSGEGSRRRTSALDLIIDVVNTEDPGSVFLSQRQPLVGISLHATASDPDGGVAIESWLWERSDEITANGGGTPSAECVEDPDTPDISAVGGWTTIAEASSATYTPRRDDLGRCLRATATYTDNLGNADDRATGVLETPVRGEAPGGAGQTQDGGLVNAAPVFPDQDFGTAGEQSDRTSRKVAENTKAGRYFGTPVGATDADGDLLIYTLGGADAASFDISRNSGQLKTRAALNYEARNTYAVVVTAADPWGAADSIAVTVKVIDVNDPAEIAGASSVSYLENGTGPVTSFSATDQDGDPIVWSLGGSDAELFTFEGGMLAFKQSPDYENPEAMVTGGTLAEQNAYSVTLMASGGMHKVVINVTNVDEGGVVSLSHPQPQAGRGLEATLRDDDLPVSDERWQWASSEDGAIWEDIERATSPSRPPAVEDVGSYLRATATYTDSFGEDKTASAVTANRVEAETLANAAPSFKGQDEDKENRTFVIVSRAIDENAVVGSRLGRPVSALDADEDVLVYRLDETDDLRDGAGLARFTIDSSSGQIRVGKKLGADPEISGVADAEPEDEATALPAGADPGPAAAGNNMYVLRVTATDPSTASATVNVIIKVGDVNEAPAFRANAPLSLRAFENSTAILTGSTGSVGLADEAYVVTDADVFDDSGTENRDDAVITYEVGGPDREYFEISTVGVLTFAADEASTASVDESHTPDYELKSSYSITIMASSGAGSRRMKSRSGRDCGRGGWGGLRFRNAVSAGAAGRPACDGHADRP